MQPPNRETIFGVLGRDPVHTFPARMAPSIALRALLRMKPRGRVLDPMMGSGTVLALARAKGHQAIGTDIDPLAVLMSRVWTTSIAVIAVRKKAVAILAQARNLHVQRTIKEAYPASADMETRRFIRYWFDPTARKELAALAEVISRVRNGNMRSVLWCGFSRLIIAKQSGAELVPVV